MTIKKLIRESKREGYSVYLETITEEKVGRSYEYYDSRTTYIDGIPHVYPMAVSDKQVLICCPNCKKIHRHGKGEGTRVSHCKGMDAKQYYIVA